MSLLCLPDEIIRNEIVIYLDVRSKSRLAVSCKSLHKIVGLIKESSVYGKIQEKRKRRLVKLRYRNNLWKLIEMFPDNFGDNLPDPSNLSDKLGKEKERRGWNWYSIGRNPNTTLENVRSCVLSEYHKNNLYDGLITNPNMTWEIMKENPDIFDLSTIHKTCICRNPNITWEIIKENPDIFGKLEDNCNQFSYNPNLTWEIVQSMDYLHTDHPHADNWYWPLISRHSNITWEIIKNNRSRNWCNNGISQNPNITLEIFMNVLDMQWDWYIVPCNPNITLDFIINFPKDRTRSTDMDRTWSWYLISGHPNITWDIIQNNQYFPFSSDSSEKDGSCKDKFEERVKIPWDSRGVSMNPNITWDIIQNNPNPSNLLNAFRNNTFGGDKFGGDTEIWDWYSVCRNPNLTWEIISEFSSKFENYWDDISINTFGN